MAARCASSTSTAGSSPKEKWNTATLGGSKPNGGKRVLGSGAGSHKARHGPAPGTCHLARNQDLGQVLRAGCLAAGASASMPRAESGSARYQ